MRFLPLPITPVFICALFVTWVPSEVLAQARSDQIGFVIATRGKVSVTSKGEDPREAKLRLPVFPTDTFQTGPNSVLKVLFNDNTVLSVAENTQMTIAEFVLRTASRATSFNLERGKLKVLVPDFYAATNSRFEIKTPTVVAVAHGTEYVVWTVHENGATLTAVAVIAGTVEVVNNGKTVTVPSGDFLTATPYANVFSFPIPISRLPQVQAQIQQVDIQTDPSVIAQVQAAMAQNAQVVQQPLATRREIGPLGTTNLTQYSPQLGAGGISRLMGTISSNCPPVVSQSGSRPPGCPP
ncbi:MAG: FecR domain-containing protein [Nitrospirae bacterium]|nr:MAG: FecR domain-containing protein [Nitrospirota bacterium]